MKQNTETTEDCLNCILHPLFNTGRLVGIHHTESECKHGKNYFVQYKRSTTSIIIGLIFLISVALIAIYNIRDLFLNGSLYSQQSIIFKLGLIVFQVNIFISLSVQMLQANLIVKERQHFFNIIHDRDLYGIHNFINKKDGLFFRYYVKFSVISILVIITIVVIAEIIYLENYQFWTVYNAMTSSIYMLVETIFCFLILIKSRLYSCIIKKSYEQIEIVLNERLARILNDENASSGNLLFPREEITRMDFPVNSMLQRLQRLHCRIMKNFRRFNNSLNPLILTHFIAHITIFILNYYLLIVIWLSGSSINSIVLKQIETNMILLVTFLVVYENEKLYMPAENILSFLNSYPLHRLKSIEMNQIDILKYSIRNISPVVSGSEVFSVRMSLLGTITATVVSYVLLALQFRATWAENN